MKQISETDHIVICRFTTAKAVQKIIHELRKDASTEHAHIVIVDDTLEELPASLRGEHVHFVKGDPAGEAALVQANVAESRAVMVLADPNDPANSDNTNLRIALTLETDFSDVFTVVECINPENEAFFQRANCDSVVCIASLTGQMLVQELQDPGVGAIVSELTSNRHGRQFYILDVPDGCANYAGVDEHFRAADTVLLGLRRGDTNHLMPGADFVVQPDDRAILISAGRPT